MHLNEGEMKSLKVRDMKTQLTNKQRAGRINWETTITMIVFHVGAVAALFMFTWTALIVSLVILWVAGSLGIGMGYHRLLTHRGYKTPKWVEYVLTVCATLTLESGPIQWVTTHRIHPAHRRWAARDVARQLGDAHVGDAAVRDHRRLDQ